MSEPDDAPHSEYPADVCILGCILLGLLAAIQHITLTKFATIPAGVGAIPIGQFATHAASVVPISWTDSILALATVGIVIALILVEIHRGGISRLMKTVLASERRTVVFLSIGCLTLVRFYWAPGQLNWAGDASFHIAYASIAAKSFAAGEIPIWSNVLAAGTPFLQFYGIAFFYLAGLLDLLVGDIHNTLKILLGFSHWLSGICMYAFVSRATESRAAGLLAAFGYVGSHWHTQQVLVMGRLPLSIFYATLPLPFLAVELLGRGGCHSVRVVGGALSTGLLFLIHPGYAAWALVFVLLYAMGRLVERQYRTPVHLASVSGIIGGGLGISLFLTVPMWLERGRTGLVHGINLGEWPDPSWNQVLLWGNSYFRLMELSTEDAHWFGGYIGLSLVLLVAGSLWISRGAGAGKFSGVYGGLAGSLILVFCHKGWLLQILPPVQMFNAGRFLLFVVFFLATATGIGFHLLRPKLSPRILVWICLLILCDVGSTSFRQAYIPRWSSPVNLPRSIMADLSQEATAEWPLLASHRVSVPTLGAHSPLVVSWFHHNTGLPVVQGLFNESPRSWLEFVQPWSEFVQLDLRQTQAAQGLGGLQRELLRLGALLFNVREVLAPLDDSVAMTRIRGTQPIMVATEMAGYPEEQLRRQVEDQEFGILEDLLGDTVHTEPWRRVFPVYWIASRMGINAGGLVCERIYVRDTPPESMAIDPDLAAKITHHEVSNQHVSIDVTVSAPCFARLSYSYDSELQVTVDGLPVKTYETASRFIAIRLEAGQHRVQLSPTLSTLRIAVSCLSALFLLGGLTWVAIESRHGSG